MRLTILILLLFFVHGEAHAAITKLLKKRRVVVIDDSAVSKGDKVCFYNASGRKRACGRVVKVKEDKSYVKVRNRKHFRRLKKGMTHDVPSGSSSGSMMHGDPSFAFRLLYTPGLMARSKFSYLRFLPRSKGGDDNGPFVPFDDADIEREDSGESKMARLFPWGSGGAEGELLINPTMSFTMGGRYTLINVSPRVASDFTKAGAKEHLNTEYSGHEFNFWLDFFPLYIDPLAAKLGIGVEFTMSSLIIETFLVEDEVDSGGKVVATKNRGGMFKGTSDANIISARLSIRRDFPLGMYGFSLGASAILSPVALSSSFTLDNIADRMLDEYKGSSGNTKAAFIEDIEDAIDHSNEIFSAILSMSFYLAI